MHEYGSIDDHLVHASIPMAIEGFSDYSSEIIRWMESHPSEAEHRRTAKDSAADTEATEFESGGNEDR